MKIERSRQAVKRLYVLGAGASYALSEVDLRKREYSRSVTPLDKDFLARLSHFCPKKGWAKTTNQFLQEQWLDRDDLTGHGLEAAIIKRVSQYDFLSSLHPNKARGKTGNAEYISQVSHLITDFLISCKSNSSGNTKKFVNAVFPIGTDPKEYVNRIITFNYDTLLERPLFDRGLSKKKVYFDRLANKPDEGMRRKEDEKFPHPLILKLHGSVNWRCSRTDFDSMINGTNDSAQKVDIWVQEHGCPNPKDSVAPLIIPPIPNKPITAASIFLHLWTTAYEYLHQAEELVIVGYSCPPTDTLARTMFTHFEPKLLKSIAIVDPDALALSRYRELMPPKVASSAKWSYFSSFREYIVRAE